MKVLFYLLIALVLVGGGCFGKGKQDETRDVSELVDRDSILFEAKTNGLIMSDEEIVTMSTTLPTTDAGARDMVNVLDYRNHDVTGWASAALADVTGGESFGLAYAQLKDGGFTLIVEMGNLPEPAQGYFYEGWLVRRVDAFSAIDTGQAVQTPEGYMNIYRSSSDLSDYNFYVLTLESDDGNSAPAEHILEGIIR